MNLAEYIAQVAIRFKAGISREHSYRGDLQTLLQSLLIDVLVTNEPARIECGSPDYILTRKGVPIGYVEAKDIGADLGSKLYKEQFDRYKAALDNFIITDYLQFHFYKQCVLIDSVYIGEISNGKIYANLEQFEHFTALIQNFALQVTQSIKSPAKLAEMMAAKAKLMAQVIKLALNEDDKNQAASDLQGQMTAFKNILIHDITNDSFADIYAQTIAYGLFAARYHDSTLETFSRQEAATLIPQSNPFLRKLFQYIAGYELDNRLIWLVDELVMIFLASDVAQIMKNFGRSTRQQDPIVHFYETFLASYDAKLRKARGVWYTPAPVVDFIVRAVDDLLKSHFKLPQGLAETSKTQVTIEAISPGSKGKAVKQKIEMHRVQILDPATGTGTFLAKTVEYIYENNFANMQGAWPAYVKEHLIPRLNGFELLMTSYAMAHLKLDMLLTQTGYKTLEASERLRIYLTNSLEEHHPDSGTLFASWLSSEANEANRIKRDAPVMVVMGNPPYSVSSSNKSEWIQKLLVDYKKDLNERNIQPLSDDYIKFIRFGQHFIDKNGEGILAYISNNSFIDGIIHRQMRKNLLETFDEIYILDLHGNAKKKETAPDGSKDENVFDIMQGVSINLFIKTGKKAKDALGQVFHHSLYGKREAKYSSLHESSLASLPWKILDAKAPEYLLIPQDIEKSTNYKNQLFGIHDLFTIGSNGVQTKRDDLFIDFEKVKLAERINYLLSSKTDSVFTKEFKIEDSSSYPLLRKIRNSSYDNSLICNILYRPLDTRKIYYDINLLGRPFFKTLRNIYQKENSYCLILGRQGQAVGGDSWNLISISKDIPDNNLFYRGGNMAFPLYIYPETNDLLAETTRTPNLDPAIVQQIANGLRLSFTSEKTDAKDSFAPIELLDYIYAVLHSPNYRETYKQFLKIDFPRIYYPTDVTKFWQLVTLGGELRKVHLFESAATNQFVTTYPASGNNVVYKPHYEANKVWINDNQYFEGVPQVAWQFYIGGYQPAQKWLKDRKGRMLSYEDILHYQKIIKALVETNKLMREVDKVLN